MNKKLPISKLILRLRFLSIGSVLAGLLGVLFVAAITPVGAEQSPEKLLKAVVKIRSKIPSDARTAQALGTEREGNGILISADGLVLTIGYLILEAEHIEITGPGGKSAAASFVGYDHETGFGLVRSTIKLDAAPMGLGDSKEVIEGDPALVVGYGGAEAVQGVRVIFRGEFAGYWEYLLENAIYTAPPYNDYGGAALIGRDGRLLGVGSILNHLSVPDFGMVPCNMFVPVNLLKPILDSLATTGHSSKPPQPWLGMHVEQSHDRVVVMRVTPGGPAFKAGIRGGDLILKVQDQAVTRLADFYRQVWSLGTAGVRVPLKILQGTEIKNIAIQSADRSKYLRLGPKRTL